MTSDAESLPGVDRAYDFVVPSYQWMLQRLEATTSRLQSLQTFAATVTFAAPVVVKSVEPAADLQSPLFLAALALFVVIGAGGLVIRMTAKGIALVRPAGFDDSWLTLPERTFKLEMLKIAGRDMDLNISEVRKRARLSDFLTVVFMAEVVLIVAWAGQVL